ncbi:hypothetical protein RBI22_18130 [Alcaligenaceae bacterium C4P045]|nr:hypothetical protein [Alcaligenaceae bacterium C4P045]
MKKTDLEKNKALKLMGDLKHSKTPARFGQGAAAPAVDRREQRRLDQAAGLVSFPVKLPQELVDQLRARAQASGEPVNDVVATLLTAALKG